jgi:predicted membrane protein (TIGR00267 family)
MSIQNWLESPRTRLDVAAGLVDGMLNALVLVAGKLLRPDGGGATLELALRVGAASALTTLFVFFVAHYAELRAELYRAEKELSLLTHGKLAAGELGRRAIRDAFAGALLAALCGLAGSLVPLVLCYELPDPYWLGIVLTIGLLGLLGAVLARSFRGNLGLWALAIMLGGIAMTWIGVQLDITG